MLARPVGSKLRIGLLVEAYFQLSRLHETETRLTYLRQLAGYDCLWVDHHLLHDLQQPHLRLQAEMLSEERTRVKDCVICFKDQFVTQPLRKIAKDLLLFLGFLGQLLLPVYS
jgi:hypothetical protein